MIKEKTMYTVICDRCGADAFADSEFSCWESDDIAIDDAVDNWDYQIVDGRHYCPDCWTYDEDEEIIVNYPLPKGEGASEVITPTNVGLITNP